MFTLFESVMFFVWEGVKRKNILFGAYMYMECDWGILYCNTERAKTVSWQKSRTQQYTL